MKIPPITWPATPAEAIELQRQMASQVISCPLPATPRWIAGVDVHIRQEQLLAIAVVLSYPELETVEMAEAAIAPPWPYIPGLFSFREGPAALAALERLKIEPDLIFFDAHGIAHPRRLGLASHMGILLDRPTIGCAKTRLTGQVEMPGPHRGDWTPILDQESCIGAVLRTRPSSHPLYISIGHRITLEEAIDWTLRCGTGYRVSEPTRRAHVIAQQSAKGGL